MRLAERQAAFLESLAAPSGSGDAGLEAYRRTVQANWRGALAAAYPVCERLVGRPFFSECAARYAAAHPARSGDLHRHGDAFAAFIATHSPAASLPYLVDVARLEWAVHVASFAADPVPFDVSALAAVPADRQGAVRLRAQAGSALIDSAHPAVSIWEANQRPADGTLAGEWRAESAVVLREGLRVRVLRAGPEVRMLRQLLAGASLEEACADEGDATSLPRWVAAGLFAGIAA